MRLATLALVAGALLGGLAPARAGSDSWTKVGRIQTIARARSSHPTHEVARGEEGALTVTVRFPAYTVWEYRALRKQYTDFTFPGSAETGRVGHPSIQSWSTILSAPGDGAVVIEAIEYEWSAKVHHARIYPQQRRRRDGPYTGVLEEDPEVYRAEHDVFEAERITLSEPRHFEGQAYRTLSLVPMGYVPATGEVRFLRQATIRLRRFGSEWGGGAEEVERVTKDHAGYLVVTPERFLEGLRPFLNFTRKRHPDLEVRTLEEIGSTVEEIDAVVEEAGRRGTRNVLLVGHSTVLPASPYDNPFDADLEPDCHDSDAVYRNLGDDDVPTLRVGRFPVVNDAELANVVGKTLRRWKNPETYQTRPLLVAHEEKAPRKYQGCVMDIVEHLGRRSRIDLEPRMVLPASPKRGGLGSRLDDLYDAMGSGTGVFLYRGHGGTDFLASRLLGYFGAQQKHWYEAEVAASPIFYSVACLNGQMTDAEGKRAMGLCENLLTSPKVGVSASIGAIQPSPTGANHIFAWYLMHYTYVRPRASLGEVFVDAMRSTMKHGFGNEHWTRAYMWMSDLYNLYGDPELPVVQVAR